MRENRNSRQDYEISPALIELTKKEQEYRHQWQEKYLNAHNFSFRLGQFFGLIYNLGLLYLAYDLIKDGEKTLAFKILALNFGIIAFAILVTAIERKVLSRKPPRKMHNNKRFNNNRDRNSSNNRHQRSSDRDRDDRR